MGVYIKNFEPQDGLYVIKDGVIRKYKGKGGTVRPYELVEVKEPHGRLIWEVIDFVNLMSECSEKTERLISLAEYKEKE